MRVASRCLRSDRCQSLVRPLAVLDFLRVEVAGNRRFDPKPGLVCDPGREAWVFFCFIHVSPCRKAKASPEGPTCVSSIFVAIFVRGGVAFPDLLLTRMETSRPAQLESPGGELPGRPSRAPTVMALRGVYPMRFAPWEFFEEPGVINDSNGAMKAIPRRPRCLRGSYPGGGTSRPPRVKSQQPPEFLRWPPQSKSGPFVTFVLSLSMVGIRTLENCP
jgi:hypothetical protein